MASRLRPACSTVKRKCVEGKNGGIILRPSRASQPVQGRFRHGLGLAGAAEVVESVGQLGHGIEGLRGLGTESLSPEFGHGAELLLALSLGAEAVVRLADRRADLGLQVEAAGESRADLGGRTVKDLAQGHAALGGVKRRLGLDQQVLDQEAVDHRDPLGLLDGPSLGLHGRESLLLLGVALMGRLVARPGEKFLLSLGLRPLPGDHGEAHDHGGDERRGQARGHGVSPAPHPGPLGPADRPGRDRHALEESPQIVGHGLGRRVASLRVLLQTLLTDHLQVARHVRVEPAGRFGCLLADLHECIGHEVTRERRAAGQQGV